MVELGATGRGRGGALAGIVPRADLVAVHAELLEKRVRLVAGVVGVLAELVVGRRSLGPLTGGVTWAYPAGFVTRRDAR